MISKLEHGFRLKKPETWVSLNMSLQAILHPKHAQTQRIPPPMANLPSNRGDCVNGIIQGLYWGRFPSIPFSGRGIVQVSGPQHLVSINACGIAYGRWSVWFANIWRNMAVLRTPQKRVYSYNRGSDREGTPLIREMRDTVHLWDRYSEGTR